MSHLVRVKVWIRVRAGVRVRVGLRVGVKVRVRVGVRVRVRVKLSTSWSSTCRVGRGARQTGPHAMAHGVAGRGTCHGVAGRGTWGCRAWYELVANRVGEDGVCRLAVGELLAQALQRE